MTKRKKNEALEQHGKHVISHDRFRLVMMLVYA